MYGVKMDGSRHSRLTSPLSAHQSPPTKPLLCFLQSSSTFLSLTSLIVCEKATQWKSRG